MGSDGLDAIVLAGGASRRMGEDKALVDLGGRTLLERALDAAAGCGRVIAVGPERPDVGIVAEWVQEDPPGAGPLHALAAGLARVGAPWLLVLACDLPFVTRATVSRLMDAARADGAIVTDGENDNPLCAVYRTEALAEAVGRLGDTSGAPVRLILRELDVVRVHDPDAAVDCDTRADVESARRRVT